MLLWSAVSGKIYFFLIMEIKQGWKTRKIMKVSVIQKKIKEIKDIFKFTEEINNENTKSKFMFYSYK